MHLFWCWFAGFFLALCWQAALRLMRNAYTRLVRSKLFSAVRFMVRHKRVFLKVLASVWIIYRLCIGGPSIEDVLDGLAVNILSS